MNKREFIINEKQQYLQLYDRQVISKRTLLEKFRINPVEEEKRRAKEG